jgi:uncharacterized HAD superfamily protein
MTSVKRQTIGIDVDDVLSRSVEGFAAYSDTRWGVGHEVGKYDENWALFWGISLEEAQKRADEIHDKGVFGTYQPFEHALPVLRQLSATKDLIVITSRRSSAKPVTSTWLEAHFPGLFQGIHYAGIWDSSAHTHHKLQQTKADICRELGVDYLIDDQLKHCIAAAEAGITALLFGDYSWNKMDPLPTGVTRTENWNSVKQYFDPKT